MPIEALISPEGDSANYYMTIDYPALRDRLACEGWRTPQCYSNSFDSAGDFPAVYMFILVNSETFLTARPAYVGMSTRLAQRWTGHPVIAQLDSLGPWVQRWFLRVPKQQLRSVEAANIQRFEPPWNVIGRRRGVGAL